MYILAIDQGTTGTTIAIYNRNGIRVKKTYRTFTQIYPKPGWVEHDPEEIWQTVVEGCAEIINNFNGKIAAVAITNQRETTLLWDKKTGKPVYHAIVWQCRRTAQICSELKSHENAIRQRTGLPLDPYFSGTKLKWLLENISGYRQEKLLFGTIDTWLIWKLTGGKIHATDHTNASRTLLFNIHNLAWDSDLLELLTIPAHILPEIKNPADNFGLVSTIPGLAGIPIYAVAGDQQAALFGHQCFYPGEVKNTYGTGCFLVMNTGQEPVVSHNGLLTTIAINESCIPCYALEGSIFIAGAVIQWLRDEVQMITSAAESESAATAVTDNGGVYLVPAFVGLGAPHWDADARGTIVGLTRGANRNHIVRAALESMAYQSADVLAIMERESGLQISGLKVDGGATANNFLMQFQADILGIPVIRPEMAEITSLGVAFLAGIQAGIWPEPKFTTNTMY